MSKPIRHEKVVAWGTLANDDKTIVVVVEEGAQGSPREFFLCVVTWDESNLSWGKMSDDDEDWVPWGFVLDIDADDPRLPDAQRAWSQRQIDAIHVKGWENGKKESVDEGR